MTHAPADPIAGVSANDSKKKATSLMQAFIVSCIKKVAPVRLRISPKAYTLNRPNMRSLLSVEK
jgi:hypothetical protein